MFKKKITSNSPRNLLLLFELLAILLIFLYNRSNIDKYTIITAAGLILVIYISNYILQKVSSGDNYIFLIVTMLLSIGTIMIYRIEPILGAKQLLWISLGILVFFITYFTLKYINKWDKLIYLYVFLSYGLFALTFLLGKRKYGAINWVSLGGISFQPAEIIKLLLIFILSAYYSNRERFQHLKFSKYYPMLMVYSFIGLLFIQRDLGMAVIFYSIFIGLQYIYEEDRIQVLYNLGFFAIGGVLGSTLFDHVKIRFQTWINPWAYIDNKGYQITQSLFAIAEGGFFGTGLGLGHPHFIPLVEMDFIFAAICEEMGIFAGIGVIMLFMILVYRGFKIGLSQDNKFYRILALGVSILFGIQSFIILAGVLKIIPLTGITLPFVAYGGSSILTSFIALAILQVSSEDLVNKEGHNE
ncbi:MAG: FtsW/RodA/SpoVE family cell cycle protein [Tissierellia bacterium]|nr:FtsW/RodA/SpoVE family cell cycle protein [Tissierellia bacterium]